jgi:hypothetical protein
MKRPPALRRWGSRARASLAVAVASAGALACTPKARPLVGVAAPARALPRAELDTRRQRIVFAWRYDEADGFSARGDGVARIAPPDSGRLDFFLGGGFGGGYAVLVGDELSAPGGDLVRRVVPPAPLLWAALGRLALPAAADTVVRTSGDTLRADIGRDPTWRATFVGPRLARLERIEGGRIVEWVVRDSTALRYRHEVARRSLAIDLQRTETTDAFPASIWQR